MALRLNRPTFVTKHRPHETPSLRISFSAIAARLTPSRSFQLPRTVSANAQFTDDGQRHQMALDEVGARSASSPSPTKIGTTLAGTREWDPDTEAENAHKASAIRHHGYIGTYNSGAAKISMPILTKPHLVMVTRQHAVGLTRRQVLAASSVSRPS